MLVIGCLGGAFVYLEDDMFGEFYYFARLRRRAFHAQVTHVLVKCLQHEDRSLSMKQRSHQLFDFQTVWSIARACLLAQCAVVTVCVADTSESDVSTVIPAPIADDGINFQVWPQVFKRQREPKDSGPPVDEDQPRARRPKQARTGGIRRVLPSATFLVAMPDLPAAQAPARQVAEPPAAGPEVQVAEPPAAGPDDDAEEETDDEPPEDLEGLGEPMVLSLEQMSDVFCGQASSLHLSSSSYIAIIELSIVFSCEIYQGDRDNLSLGLLLVGEWWE
jgi:hypothetical protein